MTPDSKLELFSFASLLKGRMYHLMGGGVMLQWMIHELPMNGSLIHVDYGSRKQGRGMGENLHTLDTIQIEQQTACG